MKNVLYIGNKLSAAGKNPTGIEILGPLLERHGYHLRYASAKVNKLKRLAEMLWMTLRSRRWAHVVLIDTYSTSNYWYAVAVSLLCRLLGMRYIPILHGGNLPSRLRNKTLSRMVFGHAFCCVAPSRYLAGRFEASGFDVRYVPNPVDLTAFAFKQRDNVRPNLIWVRSLSTIYNPMMALLALKELDDPKARLLMVGYDGGWLSQLRSFAQTNGLDVAFSGRLTQQQWAAHAANCDIFLNTSQVDNAPFSLIEALSLGLYVVSTNVGGIPYLVRDGQEAILVSPGDYAGMAAGIKRILADAELRSVLTDNGCKLVEECSSAKVIGQWRQILGT